MSMLQPLYSLNSDFFNIRHSGASSDHNNYNNIIITIFYKD